MEVAGHGFNPGVGDADQRLVQIAVGEADRLEHGARRCPVTPVGDAAAAMFEVHRRGKVTPTEWIEKSGDYRFCD